MQIDKIVEAESRTHGDQLKQFVYNPNEIDNFEPNLMSLFKPLADIIIENSTHANAVDANALREQANKMRVKYPDIFYQVPSIAGLRFQQILAKNRQRYSKECDERHSLHDRFHDIENVINAVCHPDTVKNACLLYIQQIKSEMVS